MAALAALLLAHRYSLTYVALLSFGTGVVGAFTSPALRGIVPELVERDGLQRANALLATSQNSARILGPVLASVLVSTVGGGWAVAVDALSFWLAALAFTRIPGATRPPAARQPLWRDLLDGWSVFSSLRWVVVMTVGFALGNAFNVGPLNVLGPQVIAGHDGATGWVFVQAARAAGLLAMSLVAVRMVLRRPLRDGRIWGTLSALPLLALGLSGRAWVVAPRPSSAVSASRWPRSPGRAHSSSPSRPRASPASPPTTTCCPSWPSPSPNSPSAPSAPPTEHARSAPCAASATSRPACSRCSTPMCARSTPPPARRRRDRVGRSVREGVRGGETRGEGGASGRLQDQVGAAAAGQLPRPRRRGRRRGSPGRGRLRAPAPSRACPVRRWRRG